MLPRPKGCSSESSAAITWRMSRVEEGWWENRAATCLTECHLQGSGTITCLHGGNTIS